MGETARGDAVQRERLVAEAVAGIPAGKLRRRGRPPIGDEASSTSSVRLPDDLVTLVDERSAFDDASRGTSHRVSDQVAVRPHGANVRRDTPDAACRG